MCCSQLRVFALTVPTAWNALPPYICLTASLLQTLYDPPKSAWAAITKYRTLGSLNGRNVVSHGSGGWMSEVKVWSSQASLLGWQMAIFSLYPHIIFLLCVCVLTSSSSKDTSRIGLGLTHMTSFNLNHLSKDPVSKYSHILWYWGTRASTYRCEGAQFTPHTPSEVCPDHPIWSAAHLLTSVLWISSFCSLPT